jgi:hypothetical protein
LIFTSSIGIDVCQRLSGIALKMMAIEKLLMDFNPTEKGTGIVLIQRCIRQGNRLEDEETTANDIRKLVANLNHKFGAKFAAAAAASSASGSASTNANRRLPLPPTHSNPSSLHFQFPNSYLYHPPTNSSPSNSLHSGVLNVNTGGNTTIRSTTTSHSSIVSPSSVDVTVGSSNGVTPSSVDSTPAGNASSNDNSSSDAYQPVVVDYEEIHSFKGVPIQEKLALYRVADIFLVTAIREGLNLLPLEYIYARRDLPRAGVVIASEFSTVSSLLNGALKINPFSSGNVSDAILRALAMTAKDCDYRRKRDMPFIISHPSSQWTKQIMNELEQLKSCSGHGKTVPKKYPNPLLPLSLISNAYENVIKKEGILGITPVGSRVFIFDYGGTLLTKEKFDIYLKQSLSAITGRTPTKAMIEMIKLLSEDPLNIVVSEL